MSWLQIKNVADSRDVEEIYIYGEIGDWWDELDEKTLSERVKNTSGDTIRVRVNSGGGNVFTALSVYSLLKTSGKTIECNIDGICASAATFFPCAASKTTMTVGGQFMIHDPLTVAYGNASELRKVADVLDKVGGSIAMLYKEKTGNDIDDITQKMNAETWMNAYEAQEYGFVDEILETQKIAASTKEVITMSSDRLKNIPQALLNAVKSVNEKPNEGEKPMDLTQIKAQYPDAVKAHAEEIKASIKTDIDNAVKAERQRVLDIQNSAFEGQSELVAKAIDDGLTAGEFAIQANAAWKASEQAKKDTFLAKSEKDRQVLNNVQTPVAPAPDEALTEEDKILNALEAEFQ